MCVTGWGEPGCRLSCQPVPSPQQKQARLQLRWAQPSPTLGGGGGRRPASSTRPLPGAGQQPPIWTPGRAAAPGNVQRESGGLPRFGRKRGGCGGGAGCGAGGQGQVPCGDALMARRLWLGGGPRGRARVPRPRWRGDPCSWSDLPTGSLGEGHPLCPGVPSHPAPLRAAPLLPLAAVVVQVRAGPPPPSPPAASYAPGVSLLGRAQGRGPSPPFLLRGLVRAERPARGSHQPTPGGGAPARWAAAVGAISPLFYSIRRQLGILGGWAGN